MVHMLLRELVASQKDKLRLFFLPGCYQGTVTEIVVVRLSTPHVDVTVTLPIANDA